MYTDNMIRITSIIIDVLDFVPLLHTLGEASLLTDQAPGAGRRRGYLNEVHFTIPFRAWFFRYVRSFVGRLALLRRLATYLTHKAFWCKDGGLSSP